MARLRPQSPAWLRWPRRTARLRFTLVYGCLFLLSGAVLVTITFVLFQQATQYKAPRLPKIPHPPAAIHNLKPFFPAGASLPQLTVVQNQLARDQQQLGLAVGGPLARGQQQLVRDQHQLAQAVHQLAQSVHQLSEAGTVQAAQRAADSHQLLVNSGIALAIVAVLALLAGWLVAGRMLRPIRTIIRTAQRISSTSLHERLALEGPQDELKELGDTLDDLFGRLDAAFEAQRHFVANASHELRAPLTRQRALIQVALADPRANSSSLRTAHERVLASEQDLEQLIDALLALSRGQAGIERHEQVDLAAVTAEVMLTRESQLAGLDLNVQTSLAPAPAAGDPRLIERLLTNLIENALRHNTPDGFIEITTGTRDGRASVSISNSGPTVPSEQVQRLFQPFQRLEGVRTRHSNGHGLGLSIVEAIANAHHAEFTARARAEGGLTVEVSFPPAIIAGADLRAQTTQV